MRILNIAPLASRTGRYGGPFETTINQVALINRRQSSMLTAVALAPHLRGDSPQSEPAYQNLISPRIRQYFPRLDFLFLASWRSTTVLVGEIRKSDVVHLSFAREVFPLTAALLTLVLRKRLVLQTHGMLTSRTSLLHRLVDLVVRPIVRQADVVICLTPVEELALRSWFVRNIPRLVCIGNPTELTDSERARLGLVQKNTDALFVARLHPRKRIVDFVGAAAVSLENHWADSYCAVGPDQGDLALVLQATRTLANFSYEGAIPGDQVMARVAASRVFVLSSLDEPWGNVLVQALSLGIPVVVTSSAALASDIEEYGAGIVVDDRNPNAIAHAVHALVSGKKGYYATVSANARKLFEANMSAETLSAQLARVYEETAINMS